MIRRFSQLDKINENVAEAKAYLKQIGVADDKGHIAESEPYHQLKGQIADGYMGAFTKLLYSNLKKITPDDLIRFYEMMVLLKNKKKIIVDLNILKPDYSYAKYVDLLSKVEKQVEEIKRADDIKNRRIVPGIIANIYPEFKNAISEIVPADWYVILCIKKTSSGWESDHHAELFWGCPKWCLKKPEYWKQYVWDNKNHEVGNIQYILIHKNFFNAIAEAGQWGDKTDGIAQAKWLVPKNFGNDSEEADRYSDSHYDDKRKLQRLGVTTKPAKESTFFDKDQQSITAFDDKNGNLSGEVTKFMEKTKFPIAELDIAIRKLMNYPRSEWDITIPTIEEIMNFGKINVEEINKISNEDERDNAYIGKVTESCNKIVKIMNKVINIGKDGFGSIQKQIVPYFSKNKDMLSKYFWLLMFADNVPAQYFTLLNSMEEDGTISPGPVMYAMQFACYFKDKNINKEYIEWLKEFAQRILGHIMKGTMKDHEIKAPKEGKGLDFKTTLTTVYKSGQVYTEASKIDHLSDATKQLTVKLMASFVFVYLNDLGKNIINQEGWSKLVGSVKESYNKDTKIKRFKQL